DGIGSRFRSASSEQNRSRQPSTNTKNSESSVPFSCCRPRRGTRFYRLWTSTRDLFGNSPFNAWLILFPDFLEPRHRFVESVHKAVRLSVVDTAQRDQLSFYTVFMNFLNPFQGWSEWCVSVIPRINRKWGLFPLLF